MALAEDVACAATLVEGCHANTCLCNRIYKLVCFPWEPGGVIAACALACEICVYMVKLADKAARICTGRRRNLWGGRGLSSSLFSHLRPWLQKNRGDSLKTWGSGPGAPLLQHTNKTLSREVKGFLVDKVCVKFNLSRHAMVMLHPRTSCSQKNGE